MEKKILETRVITTRYNTELESDINACLKLGYHLHGTMIITPFDDGKYKAFLYTQIMAKYEE